MTTEEEVSDSIVEVVPAKLPRYFIHMSFDGTEYHGWQRQINAHTVQAELEHHLCKILRQQKVITVGCGRTDAGVHARDFYVHLVVEKEIENVAEVLFRLNHVLPWDIAIHKLFRVRDNAHARYDAIERTYEYHLHTVRDPFIQRWSVYYSWPLDIEKMKEAAGVLLEYKDFASFCKSNDSKTTICDLRKAEWQVNGTQMVFTITADRFLRNMVRAIVGTLREVGRGKMTIDEMRLAIDGKKRALTGDSMLPHGLHLVEVKYPEGYFEGMIS